MGQDSSSKSRATAGVSALNTRGGLSLVPPVPSLVNNSNESLWPAVEALDASVWRLDLRSGRVDMTAAALRNFEKVFNIDPQCLEEGRFGFALYAHPDDRDRLLATLASGIEKSYRIDFRIVDRDGQQRWIGLRVSHAAKNHDASIGDSVWFFAENETEEKSELERQKRLLADRILSSLFGADLSRLPPEEFSSIGLMSRVSEKWRSLVEDKTIRWMGPDLAPLGPASIIEGSESLLMLMMDSLFENAIEAALAGSPGIQPWIRFEFFEDTDSVFFALSDSGAGIPLVNRGQIFEPFFSTHPESSSGLGLTLARSASEWHGGQLRLDHFSKNTRFICQIPKRFRKVVT